MNSNPIITPLPYIDLLSLIYLFYSAIFDSLMKNLQGNLPQQMENV